MSIKTGCSILLPFSLAVLGLAGGCGPKNAPSAAPAEPPPQVKAVHPARGGIVRFITLPGEVHAWQQATLYAKVSGYLKTLTVDKGSQVKQGDLIADIEVPEMLADRAKYQAEAQVAASDYQRLSESLAKAPDLVTPLSVDQARGRLDVAKANLDQTETLLKYAKITAPFSGIVTERLVDPGAFIRAATAAGGPDNAALVSLMDFTTVRIQVAVPEVEAAHIAASQPVEVATDDLPGQSFHGAVTRFAYALEPAAKTMLTEIEMSNPQLALRPGMIVTVRIGLERRDNALLLPVEALVVEKTGAFAFAAAGGQAKKLPLKTGFNDGTNVEILNGVKPEEMVILAGQRSLRDGQAIQLVEGK